MKTENKSLPFKIVLSIILISIGLFVGSVFASLFTFNLFYVITTFYYAFIVDVVVLIVYAVSAAIYNVFKEN